MGEISLKKVQSKGDERLHWPLLLGRFLRLQPKLYVILFSVIAINFIVYIRDFQNLQQEKNVLCHWTSPWFPLLNR